MLELKHVSYQVTDRDGINEKTILRGISLIVEDKSFIVITGPNGGGKSTLAKVIMGIEKPTSGTILYNGENITEMEITQRAQLGIGFAFQQPVRFKGLFVRDLLRLAAGKSLSLEEACQFLSEVGLCATDYIDREINASLSGGELKRIEIAMLMARRTTLSIFDEPEAGIDLWSFHNLIRVFEKMRDENDSAVMIISHQEKILNIADKIVVISNGEIMQSGRKEDLLPSLLHDSDTCRFFQKEV